MAITTDPANLEESEGNKPHKTRIPYLYLSKFSVDIKRLRTVAPHIPILLLALAYAIRFATLTVSVLHNYGEPAFDMAIPDQGLWLLSRFHDPFVTIMGRNLFGDHSEFILLLLVPIYWVYPHTAVLLIFQALVLAATSIPIYLLARHLLQNTVLATLLAAAYLLNPALQQSNMEQFHVECVETFLIAIALYAAVVWRPKLLLVAIICLLFSNQDAAIFALPIGIWVAMRRSKRTGFEIIGFSCLAAVLVNFLIIPLLLGTFNLAATKYSGRLPFNGILGSLKEVIRYPGQAWAYAMSQGRPWYLWQMAAGMGFVFILAPEIALIAIIALAINVWTTFGYQHEIMYHYSMPIVPILVCGTIWAISRQTHKKRRAILTGIVAIAALWSCIIWGLAPFSDTSYPYTAYTSSQLAAINQVIDAVPANAAVSAGYDFATALDHRSQIYVWPNPFYTEYWGTYSIPGVTLPIASKIQYIVMPPSGFASNYPQVWQSISSQFHVDIQTSEAILYERNAAG